MINPIQLSLTQPNGASRKVIIEPVLEKNAENGLKATGVYKIYKDAFGDESTLFTEPLEIDETNSDLPDESNPDYLGKIILTDNPQWQYTGDLLNSKEQEQVVKYILVS